MKLKGLVISSLLMMGVIAFGVGSVVAGAFIQTQVVSGTLTNVKDSQVSLGSTTYYAAPSVGKISQSAGAVVSLRYYVDNEQKNIFVEIKNGASSLQEITATPKKAKNK